MSVGFKNRASPPIERLYGGRVEKERHGGLIESLCSVTFFQNMKERKQKAPSALQ